MAVPSGDRNHLLSGRARVAAMVLLSLAALPAMLHAQPDAVSDTTSAADSAQAVVSRDLLDIIRSILGRSDQPTATEAPRRGISRSVLPSLGYNAVSGVSLGASIGLGGWLGEPADTRISSGIISASYSTKGQTSVSFKSNVVLPRNSWVLQGDWRFLDTNQPTYGLGPIQPGQTQYPIDFTLYRLYQTASRRIGGSPMSIGIGYRFDYYNDIRDIRADNGESTPYTEYSGGAPGLSRASGFSLDLVFDTRDNAINARRGIYWNGSYQFFNRSLGSDGDYQVMWSDFRVYKSLPAASRHALAGWTYLWFTSGTVPYLHLPAIGWDTYGRSGRGFLQGRMRGAHLAYAEIEYRMRLSRDDLLGAVAFGNLTSTRAPEDRSGGPLDFGFGAGLRFKLNKRTDTNVAIDLGRGSDGEAHFFIAMQEAY